MGRWSPVILIVVAALLAPVTAEAAERPIVYVISLDGLDGDRVNQGSAPFLSGLLTGGGGRATSYPESRSVMIAETNPNHTAMMTGAYGGASGIPGNAFAIYAPLENEDSCRTTGPANETRLPTVTSGENANCPEAQMLFEAVRRQGNPDGLRTAAILGKPKLGRIFAARRFDGRSRDAHHLWAPCSSGADDDEYCGSVSTNPATGYALDDATVMDEVIRTAREGIGPAGGRRRPDFTFVNLPQIDSAGHALSPSAGAYDAAIGMADDQLERLVGELRARNEWRRTVMIVLSDHSMDTTPTKTTLTSRLTAAGISENDFVIVQNGSIDAVYLANRRSPARFELLRRMRTAALGTPGVGEALYREPNPADGGGRNTIDGAHPGWRAAGERSGDLLVTHVPGGGFSDPSLTSNPLPGNHGGPQTRDNFFAVLGGGDFVRQQVVGGRAGPLFDDTLLNPRQAENVDPAPTAMGLFGLFPTRNNSGRFLAEAFDMSRLPGGGAPALRPRLRIRRLSRRARTARTRRACARVRRRAVVLRLELAPTGGRYDLAVKGRRFKHLLRNRTRTVVRFRARPGRRYRFRVRVRAASGVPGGYVRRRARPRAARCRVRRVG